MFFRKSPHFLQNDRQREKKKVGIRRNKENDKWLHN